MEYLKNVWIEKVHGDDIDAEEDVVILETRVSIFLNGQKAISTMCIPKDQDAHAIGFLMSEGVIKSVEDIESLELKADGLEVHITARIDEESLKHLYKEKTLVSGCGGGVTGNTAENVQVPFIDTKLTVTLDHIRETVGRFYDESELYRLTGCVHKALLSYEDGTTVESEDIGRHNAIDKVAGKSRLKGLPVERAMLIVSGRLSSEMVIKAVMHRIPIVISRTAPTFLGVKTAQEHGVTLIGFARGRKMNLYTHSGRIKP